MVDLWEPGTYYGQGSVVEFEGQKYKIIQAHTSQGDWTPPVTPALWGRYYGGEQHHEQEHYHESHHEEKPWDQHATQKVEVHEADQQKHWYDLSDERKKQLEVGGGLAAGLALLGAGYYAYHEHEKGEEEKKAQVWGLQNWIRDAQNRTEEFHQREPTAPTTWILTHGKTIPEGAIVGGEEHGRPVFIARAFHEGSLQIGKAGPQYEKGASIGYGHKEILLDTYEILIGDSRAIRWIDYKGKLKPYELDNVKLVEGGREANGVALYIAQAEHDGAVLPGKASEHFDGALIPWGGTEKREDRYRVLAYA